MNLSSPKNSAVQNAITVARRRKIMRFGILCAILLAVAATLIGYEMRNREHRRIAQTYIQIEALYQQESNGQEKANHDNSMTQFYDFALKHPKDSYGWQAALRAGSYYIQNNQLTKAQAVLEAILPHTAKHELIQVRVRTALAGIYASQHETDKALNQLGIVERLPRNPWPNESRFLKAQLLFSLGRLQECKVVLNEILSHSSEATTGDQQLTHMARILMQKIGP